MSKSFTTFAIVALFVTFNQTNTFSQNNADFLYGQDQMREYVNQCTATLFHPNNERPEVRKFQNDVAQKINRNYNVGFFIWDRYNTEKVYDAILNESVNFIEKQACEYAKNQKAGDFVRQELLDKIGRTSELPVGVFSEYIGERLKQKVAHLYSPTHTQSQQPIAPPIKLYPSEACCACLENFDGNNVVKVYLYPCGHDMCKECSRDHFFKFKKDNCPHCRARVDKERLRGNIY